MHFKISTQEFNYLLSKLQNVVSIKPTIPLLGNFLLVVSGKTLTAIATDLTVSIRCEIEVDVIKEGATTLPAKRLGQLLRELTFPQLEVSTNAHNVTQIIAGTSHFKINGMSQNEFPPLPNLAQAQIFTIPQKELKNLLYRTSFATSREDNRYVLTGVLMSIIENKVTFVGTDGKRLAKAHFTLSESFSEGSQSIIPLKAVEEFSKNLLDEGTVKISITADKIGIETEQTTVITKLLSGDYPDINRVIPEKSDIIISLHREELITLLKQISLFTSEQHHSVRFTFETGELKLSANTMDVGEGQVNMPVNYHGNRLEIAFNPAFFLDILRRCNQEIVTLGLTDAYNPGIILDGEETGNLVAVSPLFVIMPMRLSED